MFTQCRVVLKRITQEYVLKYFYFTQFTRGGTVNEIRLYPYMASVVSESIYLQSDAPIM